MSDQLTIETTVSKPGAVECLGLHFESDQARRAYFSETLRVKLQDPEFRKIEGFPIGSDEDILRLSDPPYYTACPNPFLADFIRCYGTAYDPTVLYARKPAAVDASEGKTDPIYTAHSYHTKVPHKAIMRAILHYTEPGDIVLDGFAGSGMTGVAAQLCGYPEPEFRKMIEDEWKAAGDLSLKWGARRAVLGDLGPIAAFISSNYNLPFDLAAFQKKARQILDDLRGEIGWMYETVHEDGRKGCINYTVWSALFTCPECGSEVNFVNEALDRETDRIREDFPCPTCSATLTKQRMEKLYEAYVDPASGKPARRLKWVPALINYSVGNKKYEKKPDPADIALIARIEAMPFPPTVPTVEIPFMHMTHQRARMELYGVTHLHHFYFARAAHALGRLWQSATGTQDDRLRNMLLFLVEQSIWGLSILNRYGPLHFSQVNRYLNGVYYVASQVSECSPWYSLDGKLRRLAAAFRLCSVQPNDAIISTGTAARLSIPAQSIDYIFTDPPFGENILYADLNFLVESWHRVLTQAQPEAVIDKAKHKALIDYQRLMQMCFAEYYRVLKPGRWMTMVFHNSRNSVWAAIQEALASAGFVVADVRTLDKQQGSYRQVTSTAVKQDLVISAYKPNGGLEQRFELEKGTEDGVWDFVRTHLRQLPVFVSQKGKGEAIAERQSYMLFDRMVAFHVQRGILVPLSAAEFYEGLAQRLEYRDGMYFLADQVDEFDKKKQTVSELRQLELIVRDEHSAIQWLRQQLAEKPQQFSDLQPQFMRETAGWSKEEQRLELSEILRLNFFRYDGDGEVPVQIRNYLSKNFHDLRGLAKDAPALQAKANEEFRLIEPSTFGTLRQITKEENLWRLYPLVVCPMDSIKPVEKRRGWSPEQVAEQNRERLDNLVAAGWDLIIVDEAHRLGGSTDQVARVKLGRALSEAAPYFLLLSATPHQGKTDAFHRILSLLDADAFPDSTSITRERVAEYVIRTEKRRAIDADGAPLFKPRHTRLIPVKWEDRHREQQLLYDAVTEYVRVGYNRAIREKRNYVGFLLLLLQRLVTSSTRAIRSTLERRLEALQQPDEQLSLFPQILEEEWSELDGQEQIEVLLKTRLKAMKNERAEVELLLEAARRCEHVGPDAKAEALIDWIYQLRQQEGDPDLKVLIFTEFVPTQQMLSEFLAGRGFSVACLNGSLDLDERGQVQQQFAGATEVLVSTEAGGEGLNLQFCHAVVNYDMPWNPMRIEQRIGRVDRIGQKHIVRALNLVLEDTVEYRVREVLEQKLAVILEEFGADKTSDVLDSPEIFDELYVEAMLHPEQVPERVEQTLDRVRQQAEAARRSIALLGTSGPLDPNVAQQMLEHPLPHWVERMTVSYLNSHGGKADRRGRVWDLTWPASMNASAMRSVSFHSQDANDVAGAAYVGLEDPRIRGLAERLPLFVPGQTVAGVRLADISNEIRGYWSLWGVRVRSRWGNAEDGGERIMPFFFHEDGRVLPPTARHIWDRLVAGDSILECHQASAPGNILEQMSRMAEEAARPLYQELIQRHRERLVRLREKGEYAFTVRRQTVSRVGLAAVRSRRLGSLEEEVGHWREEIARREEICPEFAPLVVIHVA